MKAEKTYEMIINDVVFVFEECIDEFGFTVSQATAKTIEENHFIFRKSPFIKVAYLVQLGLESITRGEIVDYVCERLANVDKIIPTLEHEDIHFLKRDSQLYQELAETTVYDIIETTVSGKIHAEYHLGEGIYAE
ncbi:hypothetical protein [Candidatus Enterococcus clewellii]|uniref:Uncharacterized protein n=1 Tax=Candidatus Enterococcus clewellii TaxID=1834193 RepID=A0A242JXA5_9ENTE|nr:hypothetical protein [Enterococcus sp. 9E7_DIV0242]OTP09862.1 hypothetical protein A5888_004058 [Enterococcus sp. 9E7_DIV0242]